MFRIRQEIKERYGNDDNFKEKENKLNLEKGDIPAMIIAAFVSLILPILIILCVIYLIVWLIFLR